MVCSSPVWVVVFWVVARFLFGVPSFSSSSICGSLTCPRATFWGSFFFRSYSLRIPCCSPAAVCALFVVRQLQFVVPCCLSATVTALFDVRPPQLMISLLLAATQSVLSCFSLVWVVLFLYYSCHRVSPLFCAYATISFFVCFPLPRTFFL